MGGDLHNVHSNVPFVGFDAVSKELDDLTLDSPDASDVCVL